MGADFGKEAPDLVCWGLLINLMELLSGGSSGPKQTFCGPDRSTPFPPFLKKEKINPLGVWWGKSLCIYPMTFPLLSFKVLKAWLLIKTFLKDRCH